MTIGNEKVEVTVVVVIKKLHSPSAHQPRQTSQPQRDSHVIESHVAVVPVERIHLLVHICNEKSWPAVFKDVSRVHPHSRAGSAVLTIGHPGLDADFFEFSLAFV